MIVVVDEFRDVVERVSEKLTPLLQQSDPGITGIHYQHGHPLEIIETLKQRDESRTLQYSKYPLVGLFQDFPEDANREIGIQSEVRLHIIIARATRPDYKASERYDNNFKPFLYPIYKELLSQIHLSRAFMVYGPTLIPHRKLDRLYWGREGLWGNKGNIFNDWIDCIEIRDMRLRINQKLC